MSKNPDEIGKQISTIAKKEINKNCETFATNLTKGIPISSDNTPHPKGLTRNTDIL